MDHQETCEIPHAPTCAARRNRGRRPNNVPGLTSDLRARQERLGEHEHGRNAWGLEPKP